MDWCGMILHPSCIPLKILLITIYFIILKKIKTCYENTKLYFLPLFRKNINFTFKSSFWHLTLDKLVINSSDLNVYWFLNFTMRHRVLNQSSCGKIWRCLLEAPCSLVREFFFFVPNLLPSLHMKTTNSSIGPSNAKNTKAPWRVCFGHVTTSSHPGKDQKSLHWLHFAC